MVRKHLLAGLVDAKLPDGNAQDFSPPVPSAALSGLGTRGAIGAVSRTFQQLQSQSVIEVECDLIDGSAIVDRLPSGFGDNHAALVESIRSHGQQVPILVRPHPNQKGRYQIAYGRRRLRACADIGKPVKAIVRPLTDSELVVAQGQENSAREDLSYIERALFASQLEACGYSRDVIMAALSVDKFGLSRLISSAVKIPRDVIEAIGPAPKAGRTRWSELALRLEMPQRLAAVRGLIASNDFGQLGSDDRFSKVFTGSAEANTPAREVSDWKADDGVYVGRIRSDERTLTLMVDKKTAGAFAGYLEQSLPGIYAEFKRRSDV